MKMKIDRVVADVGVVMTAIRVTAFGILHVLHLSGNNNMITLFTKT